MWRLEDAACGSLTPAQADRVFFTSGNVSPIARALCAACPVRERCLAETLEAEGRLPASYRGGFRAGLSPVERTRLLEAVS